MEKEKDLSRPPHPSTGDTSTLLEVIQSWRKHADCLDDGTNGRTFCSSHAIWLRQCADEIEAAVVGSCSACGESRPLLTRLCSECWTEACRAYMSERLGDAATINTPLAVLLELDGPEHPVKRVAAFLRHDAFMQRQSPSHRWDVPETMANAYENAARLLEEYLDRISPATERPSLGSDRVDVTTSAPPAVVNAETLSCPSCLSLRTDLASLKAELEQLSKCDSLDCPFEIQLGQAKRVIEALRRDLDAARRLRMEDAHSHINAQNEYRAELVALKAERANEIRNVAADMINTTFQRWRTTVQPPSSFSHEDGARFIKIMSEVVENWTLPPPPASSEREQEQK